MDIYSYNEMMRELRLVLQKEGISLKYSRIPNSSIGLVEGMYDPAEPQSIYIDEIYEDKSDGVINFEPLIIAHELGHYFDLKENPSEDISIETREDSANGFMIAFARRFGCADDAIHEAIERKKALYSEGK